MKKLSIISLALLAFLTFSCAQESAPETPETPEVTGGKLVNLTEPHAAETLVNPIEEKEELPATTLAFDADAHNFGEVKHNVPARHKFEFTNTGENDLVIEDVKVSCGCTTPGWTQGAIKPGEKGFVTAEFNAAKTGVFRKSVTVIANTEPKAKVLTISGEVLAENQPK